MVHSVCPRVIQNLSQLFPDIIISVNYIQRDFQKPKKSTTAQYEEKAQTLNLRVPIAIVISISISFSAVDSGFNFKAQYY